MKKIALFLSLLALTFTASAEIPFNEAWSYVASFTSYKIGVTLGIMASLLGTLFIKKRLDKKGVDGVTIAVVAAILFVLLFTVLAPVAECAANSFVKDGVTTFIR